MEPHYLVHLSVLVLLTPGPRLAAAQSIEEPFPIVASDGFEMDGLVSLPAHDGNTHVERVVILLHGSGPQSMDEDLTAVTKDGEQNLFFKELSDTLSAAGFAVVRYHKRSYQANVRAQEDPAYARSETLQAFAANPLKYFVEDAAQAVRQARERFPDARIYLLGHSQGSYIALQVAHTSGDVAGLALIGFSLSSTDVLIFEQTVYRPLSLFDELDTDGNGTLSGVELSVDDPVATSLRGQLAVVDLDANGAIERLELQAGNLSNLMLRDIAGVMRMQEAAYPRPAEILAGMTVPVVFFQGLWDNQTPAYHAKAVELVARHVWGKQNFRFFYFPDLGHALDARTGYGDLQFSTIHQKAKASVARELAAIF